MNYLAHAYLSFGDPDILAGNMISDFVKGKKKFDYPERIQMGITLHRKIDEYTDTHPATRQAKQFLKTSAGLYAGSFVDIIYDHFLANDSYEFEEGALADFHPKYICTTGILRKMVAGKIQKILFLYAGRKTGFYTTGPRREYIIASRVFAAGQNISMIRNPYLRPLLNTMKS